MTNQSINVIPWQPQFKISFQCFSFVSFFLDDQEHDQSINVMPLQSQLRISFQCISFVSFLMNRNMTNQLMLWFGNPNLK
jgi:hypothetical protein